MGNTVDRNTLIALVTAAQSGDAEALSKLLEATYDSFYFHAYITTKDSDMAEDITQDACVEIVQGIQQLREPAAFESWGRAITHHIAIRYLKQQRTLLPLPEDEVLEQIEEENESVIPAAALDKAELNETLRSFLAELVPEQREAVLLYYFEDQSLKQIAQVQGVAEATVKSRLAYARKAIRQALQEYEQGDQKALQDNEKQLYDVHISYAYKDLVLAKTLAQQLRKANLSVFLGDDSAIRQSRIFVPIISKNAIGDPGCRKELHQMLSQAQNRAKDVLVVCYAPDLLEQFSSLSSQLAAYQILIPSGTEENSIGEISGQISSIIQGKKLENVLFDKLSEFINVGLNDKASEILCQLIQQLCLTIRVAKPNEKGEHYSSLISYLENMTKLYIRADGEAVRNLATRKLEVLENVRGLLKLEEFNTEDLYYISIAIRLIYLDRENRQDCMDALGDDGQEEAVQGISEQEYAQMQQQYVDKYHGLLASVCDYPEGSQQFILTTEQYIYRKLEKAAVTRSVPTANTPEDELLQSVAVFMREGNKLFDLIGEKQSAKAFMQCLITSYERLKSYCEVVGAMDICAECIERISELKHKIIETVDSGDTVKKSEAGIKTLLGLTVPKSGQYDVFISHKHEDYDLALEVYEFLRKNLKEPFLDRVSLPQMSKAEYGQAIDDALDGSRHLITVLSDVDHLNSRWVSYEMNSFHNEMRDDRKPGGNLLLVVTEDAYEQIMTNNKRDLKYAYRSCEIIRMSEYKKVLLSYIT